MFSSLVRFESKVRTDWQKDPKVYDALPLIYIDFAKECQIDDGYRLLKRYIRHAFDSRCQSMDKGVRSLILSTDCKVGIRLGLDVPASMRKNIYQTEIVTTRHHQKNCVVYAHVNASHRVTRGLFICIHLLFCICS